MVLSKVRSYQQEIMNRFGGLLHKSLFIEFMGFVQYQNVTYPLFCLKSKGEKNTDFKNVVISAGIHGEEPGGVYALLEFLKLDISDFTDSYRFLIFPCINPFGFEYNHRFNPNGHDINRQFKSDGLSSEATKVMNVLGRKSWKFDFTIDLHETDPNWADEGFRTEDNPKTFYMWETCLDKSIRIGDKVIEEVKKIAPVCEWDKVYDDVNHGGVIWYPEGCGNQVYAQGTTFDAFLATHYTSQSFTLETPCGWSMEQRVLVHRTALRSILELKRNV